MSDLLAFLAARLDEDEAAASGLLGLNWTGGEGHIGLSTAASMHIVRHDPARVLREVAAGRQLLLALEAAQNKLAPPGSFRDDPYDPATSYTTGERDGLLQAAKVRAAVYSDHPDYDQAWRP